jgi:carbon monoxide dehydrogenase subunit G
MTEVPSTQASGVPSAAEFTASPLRNRLVLELEAPVSQVWALLGDLSRFPEYSAGLERVDVELGEDGRCAEYTCHFKPVAAGAAGAVSRDVMKWYEPERGYLSVEVEGDAGTDGAVAFTTLEPTAAGTRVDYRMHYAGEEIDAMKAHLHDVFADMAERLIERFGGRVLDRWVER